MKAIPAPGLQRGAMCLFAAADSLDGGGSTSRTDLFGQLTRSHAEHFFVEIYEKKRDPKAPDGLLTVDQPPLAVGVRFPLCPQILASLLSRKAPRREGGMYGFLQKVSPRTADSVLLIFSARRGSSRSLVDPGLTSEL